MRRYKITDCILFALLLCLLEALSAWALSFFPGEAYTFSPTLFIALLMTMRWGGIGAAYAVLGGAVYTLANGGESVQYAVYIAGNVFFALNLACFKLIGAKKLRESFFHTALFCGGGYLSLCLGRALVSWILGQGFWLIRFLAVDALSAIITLVFLWIAKRQNGLYEPQREYLIRLKRDEEEQRHGK